MITYSTNHSQERGSQIEFTTTEGRIIIPLKIDEPIKFTTVDDKGWVEHIVTMDKNHNIKSDSKTV